VYAQPNPHKVVAVALVSLCGLGYAYIEDNSAHCTCLNLIQYNTSNTSSLYSHNSVTVDVKTGSKLSEHREGKTLCEDVCELRCRRNIDYADLPDGDLLLNKIEINIHMLGALMLNRVGGKVHDTNVVVVDKGAPRRRALELMEQLMQPCGLNDVVGDGTVLSLRAGLGDDCMSFG
jgi:hypothetical protein